MSFVAPLPGVRMDPAVAEALTPDARTVLRALRAAAPATVDQLVDHVGLSPRAVKRGLLDLMESGVADHRLGLLQADVYWFLQPSVVKDESA